MRVKASDYMEHIRMTKRKIELVEKELDAIDDEMITVPGINYDANRVTSSPRQDKLEMQVIRLIEIKEELTAELLDLKQRYILDVHEAMGYKVVARYHQCGSKFGRWYNIIEMEKIIGERKTKSPPKKYFQT